MPTPDPSRLQEGGGAAPGLSRTREGRDGCFVPWGVRAGVGRLALVCSRPSFAP